MTRQIVEKRQGPVKVLVVDDSPMMCKAIEQILSEDREIEVSSKALSGMEALKELASNRFDVCTLDVHMPGMNGLSVLKNIMVKYPLPTLMVSAFTGDGSRVTFEALRFGAVDFFKKPTRNGDQELKEQGELLRSSLKRAARVQVKAARYLRISPVGKKIPPEMVREHAREIRGLSVVYGSIGGYSSLLALVPHLSLPLKGPVVISMAVTHENLKAFVDYLQPFTIFPLKVCTQGDELNPGTIYFLPRDYAAHFDRTGRGWEMTVKRRPIESDVEGAIDLTLLSASESFGDGVLSVFISGDNRYGLTGAKEVLRNKGRVVVQRPEGCLAPYSPQLMIEELAATAFEPYKIAQTISSWKA